MKIDHDQVRPSRRARRNVNRKLRFGARKEIRRELATVAA